MRESSGEEMIKLLSEDLLYVVNIAEKLAKTIDNPQEAERDFKGFVLLSKQKPAAVNNREQLIAMVSVASVVDAYVRALHGSEKQRNIIAPGMSYSIEQMVRGSADNYPTLHRLFKKGGADETR